MKCLVDMSDCVSEQDLRRYRARDLGEADTARVRRHLAECDRCVALDAEFVARHEDLIGELRGLGDRDSEMNGMMPTVDDPVMTRPASPGDMRPTNRRESSAGKHGGGGSTEDTDPVTWCPAIPDYELIKCIGKGAFGHVWLARQKLTGAFYAIKTIAKGRLAAIELEGVRAYMEQSSASPYLVHLQHVGETPDCHYYVMELADDARGSGVHAPEGYEPMTLSEELSRRGTVSPDVAVDIVLRIVDALEHVHQAGLLHRDVKPANVVRCNGTWKLGDLGLMTRHARIEARAGTPCYAPPGGVMDRGGDLYCVGATLAELITGGLSDSGVDIESLARRTNRRSAEVIAEVLERSRHRDPTQRYQTAADMREALAGSHPFTQSGTDTRKGTEVSRLWFALIGFVGLCGLMMWIVPKLGGGRNPAGTASRVRMPLLELWHKQPSQLDYIELREDRWQNLPLELGTQFIVHAKLRAPGYIGLWYVTDGKPLLLVATEEATREVHFPSLSRDRKYQDWKTLEPPVGTESIVLLVSEVPFGDVAELTAELASVQWPRIGSNRLLAGPLDSPTLFDVSRSRGISKTTTVSPRGPPRGIHADWLSRFRHTRILAFPLVAPTTTQGAGDQL